MTAEPFIEEYQAAYHAAVVDLHRRHNHRLDPLDLIRCDCGQLIIVAMLMTEFPGDSRVVICEGCGDWHSVLFK